MEWHHGFLSIKNGKEETVIIAFVCSWRCPVNILTDLSFQMVLKGENAFWATRELLWEATGQNWAMFSSALVSRDINYKHSENTPRELDSKPQARSPSTLSKDTTKALISVRKHRQFKRWRDSLCSVIYFLAGLAFAADDFSPGPDWTWCSLSSTHVLPVGSVIREDVLARPLMGSTVFNVIPEIKVCQFLATCMLAATESILC